MALAHLNVESTFLNGNTDVNIILPDKPRELEPQEFYKGEKYKVLWLLHGTYGDYSDWIRKTNIELYACEKNLVVVMPSAMNSNYCNWSKAMMGYAAFDYLTQELMPMIYDWFPVSLERKDNFIAGLSMGGGGALKYALNYPEKFAAAACLSYAPLNFHEMKKEDREDPRFAKKLENAGGWENYLASNENMWDKIKAYQGRPELLPRLYMTCGTEDFGFSRHVAFKKYAQELQLNITFEETETYRHEWRFWEKAIQKAINFFEQSDATAGNLF